MDPNGDIYRDDEDKIPAEDKARLEGYLHARAEETERAKVRLESLGSRPEIIVDGADEETTRAVAAALDKIMRGGAA